MNTTDTVSLLREALYLMLQQFTGTPSTLADTEARAKAHKALAATAAPVAAVQPAGEAPTGFAAVPLIPNAKMRRVMEAEGWAWEDLLGAAEAITEEQYDKIATSPEAIVLGAIPAASAPAQPEAKGDESEEMMRRICKRFNWRTDGRAALMADRIRHQISDLKASIGAHKAVLAERDEKIAKYEAQMLRMATCAGEFARDAAPVPAAPADKGELSSEVCNACIGRGYADMGDPETGATKSDYICIECFKHEASEFPPLPETRFNGCGDGSEPLYTPDMMHAYVLADRARQAAIAQPSAETLLEVIRIVRNYPDFDDDTNALAVMMDEALAGKTPALVGTIDSLANGRRPAAAPQPPSTGSIWDDGEFRHLAEVVAAQTDPDKFRVARRHLATFIDTRTAALIEAASKERGGDALDAERYRWMMTWQDRNDHPEEIAEIADAHRKAHADGRLRPTREEYEAAIDAAIATTKAAK